MFAAITREVAPRGLIVVVALIEYSVLVRFLLRRPP